MRKIALYITVLLLPAPVWAGGLNVIGGRGGGADMSGAYNAISDDASLFYYNPSGLLQFKRPYSELIIEVLKLTFTIKDSSGRHTSKNDVVHLLPLGCYIHPLNDELVVGIGLYVPYGHGAVFKEKWPFAKSDTLISLTNISPAIGWQICDKLSLGLQLNIGIGQMKYQANIPEGWLLSIPTNTTAIGIGFGATIGTKYQITDELAWGLTYTTPTHVNLSARTHIALGALSFNKGADGDITFPAKIGSGIAYQLTEKWLLAFDANYYFYESAMKNIPLKFHGLPLTKNTVLKWKDNYSLHLGSRYLVNKDLSVSAGVGYQTASVPDDTISQLTPDVTGWDVATGIVYKKNNWKIDSHLIYAWGDREVKPKIGRIGAGHYSAQSLTLGLRAGYSF
ncbi:MAG: outer membrane protein transport protein [bacterium]